MSYLLPKPTSKVPFVCSASKLIKEIDQYLSSLRLQKADKQLDFLLDAEQSAGNCGIAKKKLLLTGGSGFLGVHLISRLLKQADIIEVTTIVRSIDRLKKAYLKYCGIPLPGNITIIENDLSNMDNWPDVDIVIHCAAQIHCAKSLNQLWDNVVSTKVVIDAYLAQNVTLAIISSLSVFVSSNKYLDRVHFPELLKSSDDYCLYGGYAQSKYLCEELAKAAGAHIIRPGLITGSTETGLFPDDFFTLVLRLLNETGCYPDNFEESSVDVTPVNICSDIIVDSVLKWSDVFTYETSQVLHVANKESIKLSSIIEKLKLNKVSEYKWLGTIANLGSLEKTLLMFAFFKTRSLATQFERYNIDLFQSTNQDYTIDRNFNLSNTEILSLYIDTIIGDSDAFRKRIGYR